MKLLALDTASEACSVALDLEGELHTRYEVAPRRHAELILPMCDALLAEAGMQMSQLDAMAFGRGPGSFTGVRIAAGITQGIAFGADLPVLPISTLAALAQETIARDGADHVLVALDARMQEVYWGAYRADDKGLAALLGEEMVVAPAHVPLPKGHDWVGVGQGWERYGEVLNARLHGQLSRRFPDTLPNARYLIPLARAALERGESVPADRARPVYLRDKVTHRPSAL